jgi:hypothetical protein
MKVLIATPLHDGRADRDFINGLLQCHGLYYAWACVEGQANISLARDMIAGQFLASDCTTLVMIDGDIGFGRHDVEALLRSPHSVTSGMYPRKREQGGWVFVPLGGSADNDIATGKPFRVRHAGAGFLRVERRVFTDLIKSGNVTSYPGADGRTTHHFFRSGVAGNEFLSEDYYFCELATQAGHPVYVDPQIRLRHIGRRIYVL